MPHTAILGNRIFVALFESHIVVLGLGLFNHHVHDAEAGTFAGFFFFFFPIALSASALIYQDLEFLYKT